MLVYEDIEAAQRFLAEAFGFERGVFERDPSGNVVHAEVFIGDSVIWLHRVASEHGLASARSLPALPGSLVTLVGNVDAHYERAQKAGATIDSAPANQSYGQPSILPEIRRGYVGISQRERNDSIRTILEYGKVEP